jgi:uncharacterized repeat protein (TIGR03803 family)
MLWGGAAAAAPTEKILYVFKGGNDGALPAGNLVADKSGALYGTTYRGGLTSGLCQADDGCGTVFELKPPAARGGAWTESIVYRFGPFAHPAAGLIIDDGGNLYGTTTFGGPSQNGTVFELKPPLVADAVWTQQTLYSFNGGNDGATPVASVTRDENGNLYGTTEFGCGPCMVPQQGNGCGTVFELKRPTTQRGKWVESILYSFAPFNDYPEAGLIRDSHGNLYGTTAGDRSASFGSVFELSPSVRAGSPWTEITLYLFGSGSVYEDGATPYGGLIFDDEGSLYGLTNQGGADLSRCAATSGCGTGFELTNTGRSAGGAWSETQLYLFNDGKDGGYPYDGLTADTAGNYYGTTFAGGSRLGQCQPIGGCGVAFELKPPAVPGGPWTEIPLHEFLDGADGQGPEAGVILRNGVLFGTTVHGGGSCAFAYTCGTIFSIVP